MPNSWFGPDDVVNRRVSRHVATLLPNHVPPNTDFTFHGVRVLPPGDLPEDVGRGACKLSAYVGRRGQFLVAVERRFDPHLDGEWACYNRIERTDSAGVDSLDTFEYVVRTAVVDEETRTARTELPWRQLGETPAYGGREAQAAVLLAEKLADRRAEATGATDAASSLRRLGSLWGAIDHQHVIDLGWEEADALLGPESDTIAASATIERIESDAVKKQAIRDGVDFLTDDLGAHLDSFATGADGSTLADDIDPEEAQALLEQIQGELDEMREGL
jgi:hypothetical protein